MPYYKTTVERQCFSFGGKVTQSFDVVFFRKEATYKDEYYRKFQDSAMEAASKQVPQIDYKNSGLPLGAGWSSAMGMHKFEKLNIPWLNWKIQKPSPGKPVIACGYTVKDPHNIDGSGVRRFRATGFYKLIPYKRKDTLLDDILGPPKRKWSIIHCLPSEATIISGAGICGSLDLIKNVEVGDLVQWEDISLKQEQWQYVQTVKRYDEKPEEYHYQNSDLNNHYATKWAEELSLTV